MENDDNRKKEEKGGWLQNTANWFVIIEAVINIVSHLTRIYSDYNEITKVNSPVENDNTNNNNNAHNNDNQNNMRSPAYPLNPPNDIETDNESEACKICFTNKIQTINLPCGHLVFCFACCNHFIANNYIHNCPICRQLIKEIKITYN